jgi:hypothetical protein
LVLALSLPHSIHVGVGVAAVEVLVMVEFVIVEVNELDDVYVISVELVSNAVDVMDSEDRASEIDLVSDVVPGE